MQERWQNKLSPVLRKPLLHMGADEDLKFLPPGLGLTAPQGASFFIVCTPACPVEVGVGPCFPSCWSGWTGSLIKEQDPQCFPCCLKYRPSNRKWTSTGDLSGGSDSKASAYNAGDLGSIPGSGRSPGEGNSNPPQYSCLAWMEEPGRLQSMGSQRVGHDGATSLSLSQQEMKSMPPSALHSLFVDVEFGPHSTISQYDSR